MDSRLKLENGYELSFPKQAEKYTIIDVIGRGSSTIAYSARMESGIDCILKEYCPKNLHLVRDPSGHLQCTTSHDSERFERGKQEFVAAGNRQKEIRNIIPLRNGTPPFLGTYEANNTQYSVIIAFVGKTFDQLSDELLPIKIKICRAIAQLINQYHQKGYLCLDIKPNNIFVLTNSSGEIDTTIIEYIDFDSIRKKDELSFGRSISYTKNWAAPEQTNPYRYSDICEATDIYTIGELVFWSVFNRHSYDHEHRDYSVYPFNEARYPKVKRNIVQNILTGLFHSTLRPSPRNRFQTMGELIQLLDKLVEELEKKEYIIEAAIQPKEFFIGRDNELRQIDDALHKHDIVFVSGIAGIGKSELIKHYICAHKKEYDNILYWTYNGDIDNMVAQDITVSVSGLQKIPEESDLQYAERKLRLVNELTSNSENLIVIDNLNQLIDELPQERTWERIKALHGKILITTRACENLYQSVTINTLSNTNDLIRLFREYYPFSDEEFESVYGIINSVDHHTLLVELLAHFTKATHTSPGQTLEKLQNNGITGLSNETVRLRKDDRISSNSVHEHIKKIFSMETISDNHILILTTLAFLPVDGVTASKFTSFFSIENYEDINWLISHGWISSISGIDNIAEDTIKIHPAIASVVVEYLNTKETLREEFFKRNCGAIKNHNFKQLTEAEQVRLANSLAASTIRYSIKCRSAAIFINQYIDQYSKYGNTKQKCEQIEFAIEALESSIGIGKYSAVLEESYYLQANILYTLQKHDCVIQICEEHLGRAKQVNDIYFIAKWSLLLQRMHINAPIKYLRYSHLAASTMKNIRKKLNF